MAMTPWAYNGDLATRFNMARFLLGETDADTAILTDAEINSALGISWHVGMSVLAQNLLVHLGGETTKAQEQGAASYEWDPKARMTAVQAVKIQADNCTLPDPQAATQTRQGSITVANQPQW